MIFASTISAALALWWTGADLMPLPLYTAWFAVFFIVTLLPHPTLEAPCTSPLDPCEYKEHGLGPLEETASSTALYLDMLKRVLVNVVYHEQSHQFLLTRSIPEGRPDPLLARSFSLRCRCMGEDMSFNTLTMVGLRRLDNIQHCVETLLKDGVWGDLIETGCAKGGACIFMKATLRAHEDRTRKVFCCDTFSSTKQPPSPLIGFLLYPLWLLMRALAQIPFSACHRKLYAALMRLQHSFPVDVEHASEDTIRSFIFFVRNTHRFVRPAGLCTGTGLAEVKSHFARLGLLDERVFFLKGFFSDTLPTAPISQLALIRLDGDLYASTMDSLKELYPKLQSGGFCIVDDYYSFTECRQAVDEYRTKHGIVDELVRIDNMSVFWRRA
eukprot:CAMPEP_0119319396 /NCGR_PEP_ID=MMETSP1333-20130426/49252_1 /TAXON_ID=418940 /ORGANISM="Scyphosphaera apsteinii, Strain RCC1455" /LENGTH=383 /DNA_ID=CAMNT_0007325791 /DNA_START=245 /DNA_END=1396 /DNA_ORIENTATION=+